MNRIAGDSDSKPSEFKCWNWFDWNLTMKIGLRLKGDVQIRLKSTNFWFFDPYLYIFDWFQMFLIKSQLKYQKEHWKCQLKDPKWWNSSKIWKSIGFLIFFNHFWFFWIKCKYFWSFSIDFKHADWNRTHFN